jgi:sugar-specific transcriptional regulator TrmB
MARTTSDVRALLEQRIREIEKEVGQLSRALKHLDGGRRSKRSKKQRRPGKRKPQAKRGQRREQLLQAIKTKPGSTGAELARKIGIAPPQAYSLLRKLEAEKLISKQGTRYSPK